ncbi:MAG: helix-turn-helix domain-containing protein [Bacteroidaceae bacterium]|nr:helix-turn-helix domain-containing protein [Bacteroidaceae bacterium]
MYSEIELCVYSISLAVNLICGIMLWMRRKEVSDYSRTYLSLIALLSAVGLVVSIAGIIFGYRFFRSWSLLDPMKSLGGLPIITLFLSYALEVLRPRQLRGYILLLLWLPSVIVALPLLAGVQFQELYTWSDLWNHLLEWDVLFRLLSTVFLFIFSILLLFIPYNWRRSSADYRWVRRFTFLSQIITLLYFGHVFTNLPIFMSLHILWGTFVVFYFYYFERHIRVLPPPRNESNQPESELELEPPTIVTNMAEVDEETYDFWPMICQVMDEWEAWRNPNTTVETVSTAVGTNRIYVARCIKEHTGLTFNDYMNEKRINYMAAQLRLNPLQDHKHLYFDVGFRSRHTAYRNFVKFVGSSPTDFIASLS